MSDAPVRAVMVGCGGMANSWVQAIAPLAGRVELVGLVDISRAAAEKLAQKHQLDPSVVFDSLPQAIRKARPEAVFDVTIPAAHHTVTLQALKAGCHVLGEKPMSDTLARARRMVAAAAKAGRTYAVIQNRRYNPKLRSVVSLLRSGRLGAIEEVHADFYLGPHFGGFRDQMDHPLIVDMAIHTLDAGRFLCDADPVSAYCHAFNPKRSWYRGDASAVIIFEMAGGTVFTYRGSWCAQGRPTSWESEWRVVCGQGALTWDGQDQIKAQAVVPPADGAGKFMHDLEDVDVPAVEMPFTGHSGVIDEFIRGIRSGRKPLTDCADNIKSLAMVLAAVKSARTGKREKVQW